MTRVLVLGGTGFVGPFVVKQLVEAGHDVTLFHRGAHEPEIAAGAEHVHGDFTRLSAYVPELAKRRPEAVIDVSPGIGKDGHGVLHFAGIAERALVLTSMDVYRAMTVLWGGAGPPQPMPVTEDSELRDAPSPDLTPDLAFDNLDVERAVGDHRAELPTTILRCPVIYGPLDTQRRLRDYVRQMDAGSDAIVLDAVLADFRLSRGYVENIAAAVATVISAAHAAGRTYNVGDSDALTETEWVEAIGRACSWHGDIVATEPATSPVQDLYADTSMIRRELGYEEPIDREEALRRAVEWERAQPA